LAERRLPKAKVAGSTPVHRSTIGSAKSSKSTTVTTIERNQDQVTTRANIKQQYRLRTDDEFRAAASSSSIGEALRVLGVVHHNNALYNWFRKRCQDADIDISHMPPHVHWPKGKSPPRIKVPAQEIFSRIGPVKRRLLLRALTESGVQYKCKECGIGPEWLGKPLTLEVDHVDGNRSNNSKRNLRFLCPNCHTQTPTYGRKGTTNNCECGAVIRKHSTRCLGCSSKKRGEDRMQAAIKDWPDYATLKNMVDRGGYAGAARELNRSDKGVKRALERLQLLEEPKPS
jgi:hypothetical protein